MDATFKVVPDPFKQLFVTMAKDAATEMYLLIFHVLMTGKSTFLYKYALHSCLAVLGHDLVIASITCDFEKALMQAIKSRKLFHCPIHPIIKFLGVFGCGTVILECLFHWKQVAENEVRHLMRPGVLDILTVIPHNEICTIGFEFIRQKLHQPGDDGNGKLELFFRYFRATWMTTFFPSC